jgi:hypothetical protein
MKERLSKEHSDYLKFKDTFIGEKKRALPSGIIIFLHWKLRRRRKKRNEYVMPMRSCSFQMRN